MGHTIAIDLGTTFCSVAVPEQRVERGFRISSRVPGCSVILDRFGRSRIPALLVTGASGLLIGSAAARAAEAGSAIRFAKRCLGQGCSFDPGPEDSFSPGQAVAHLFQHLKLTAEERLGGAVTSAVLAVPAHFSLTEIQLISQAASEAGLNVTQIVSEPVATALAYSAAYHAGDNEPLRLLVCNVGGGSFEASILETRGEAISVLATDGDPRLGGCDFDEALAHWIAAQLCSQDYDLNLDRDDEKDQRVLRALMVYAERVKITLSSRDCYELFEPSTGITDHSGQSVEIDLEITRADFESLISRQIERMLELTSGVFERVSSAVHPLDLSQILLTGGSSRTPLLVQRLEEEFGLTPVAFEPDLAVVLGTALVARRVASEGERPRGSNMLPRAISVGLADGLLVIAPEGTLLPHRAEIQIKTADSTRPIRLPLVDGAQAIGEIVVEGIPPALPVGSNLDLHLMIREDFGIEAHAVLEGAEVPSSIEIGAREVSAPNQADSPWHLEPPREVFQEIAAEIEQLLEFAIRDDSERAAFRRQLQAICSEAERAYDAQNVIGCMASFDALARFRAHIEEIARKTPAGESAPENPPPSELLQILAEGLHRLEQQAQTEGRFTEFEREFEVASDLLKAIDPNAPQSLREIEAWVHTQFTPLRDGVLAQEPPGFLGGESRRSGLDSGWAHRKVADVPTHDLDQARAAIDRGEHAKASGPRDSDETQREWLATANRAAEAGDWNTAISYATRLMRDPGCGDRDDIARQVLAPLLANRGVLQANQAVEALNNGISDPKQLQSLIEGLRAAERDLSDAARLEPQHEDLQQQVIVIRQILDRCEVEQLKAEARQAVERDDWDSAVDVLNRWLRAAPESEKPSIQQNLVRCLINRAGSRLRFVGPLTAGAMPSEVLGAIELAVNDLNEALRLDPSNKDATRYLKDLRRALAVESPSTSGVKPGKASSWIGRMFGKGRNRPTSQPAASVTETQKVTEPFPTERRGAPEVPGTVDNVHFSVTAPPLVLPGAMFILTVWAYLERQRAQVIERAREELGGGEIYIQSKGPVPVPKGAVLTVRVNVEGLSVDDGEDTILWTGEIGEAGFPVRVPQDAVHGAKHGLATIHIDGMQIAKIHFAIQVGATTATSGDLLRGAPSHCFCVVRQRGPGQSSCTRSGTQEGRRGRVYGHRQPSGGRAVGAGAVERDSCA